MYPYIEKTFQVYGPDVTALKAFCWKVKYPPKIKHFLWQIVSRCISVKDSLRARGIQGDTQCSRYGTEVESVNHVFFKCFLSVQV